MLGRLLVHVSNYSIGNLLVTIASFISFPIFTRVFPVDEYGILSLVSSLLLFACGLGKLGIQHAIPRFYAEFRHGKAAFDGRTFYSTVLLGMGAVGIAATALWLGAGSLLPAAWVADERIRYLMALTAPLVFVRIMESALVNILRAQQRSALLSAYTVCRRYMVLFLVLVTIFWVLPSLTGLYLATMAAESGAVIAIAVIVLRSNPLSAASYSSSLHRSMLAFGIPMIGFELGGIVLNVGDRYMLQALIGYEAVGVYSAAYNVCEYVQFIVIASVGQALVPAYTRIWEERGAAETARFVEQVLHFYLLLAAAVLAGLVAVGPDVLSLLASSKYAEGGVVIPWVMAGLLTSGSATMLGAGIYIHKQTRVMMVGVLLAAALNLALNAVLIPAAGIRGAAVATLASELLIAVLAFLYGRRTMRIVFPGLHLLKFLAMGAAMYWAVTQVHVDSILMDLTFKVVVGCLVYGALAVACDRRARSVARMVAMRFGWSFA